jgi:hypothetical protein
MSGLFKSKDSTPTVSTLADPYGGIRNSTLSWLQSQIGKSAPQYSGEMVAPATKEETQSLDFLKGYVNQPTSEGMNMANEELRKTMANEYDPTTSPYYQVVKAESAHNLGLAQQQIADQAAGGGRYWSGARLKEQGNASNEAALAMNKLIYGMAENERGNRLQAVPLAAQIGQYEEQQPLAKAQALQSLGSLNRAIQQARDEAIYNEWLRSTQEYPLQIASMGSGLSREPYYSVNTNQKPNIWSTLAGALPKAASSLMQSWAKG